MSIIRPAKTVSVGLKTTGHNSCVQIFCILLVVSRGHKKLARDATHSVEMVMGDLGLKDVTRKRRLKSQTPREWAGSIRLYLGKLACL